MMGYGKSLKLVNFNPFKETKLPRPRMIRRIQNTPIDLWKIAFEGVYVLYIKHKNGDSWLKVGKTGNLDLEKRLKQIEREFNSRNGYLVTPLYWSVNYGLKWERHTCFIFEQRSQEYLRVNGLDNDTSFGMYRKELFKLTKEQDKDKTALISDLRHFHNELWNNPKVKTVGHLGRL